MKRLTMALIGVALIVTGIVWIRQGTGHLKGSFMTGQAFWGWMGVLALLAGIPVLIRGLRRS